MLLVSLPLSFAQINADDYPNDKLLNELRSTRGYTYEDEVSRCRLLEKFYLIYFFAPPDHLLGAVSARLCKQVEGFLHGTSAYG